MSTTGSPITGAERELITSLLADARGRFSAAACSVALVEDDHLCFVAAAGEGADEVVGLRIPLDRGIAGWVTSSGQAIAVNDVHADRRFDRDTAEQTGYVPQSILAVPVEDGDDPIGVLEVLDRAPAGDDLVVAARVARQVALIRGIATASDGTVDGESGSGAPKIAALVAHVRRVALSDADRRRVAVALVAALLDA